MDEKGSAEIMIDELIDLVNRRAFVDRAMAKFDVAIGLIKEAHEGDQNVRL